MDQECVICGLPTNNPAMHMIWHSNQDRKHAEIMHALTALANGLNTISSQLKR